jgi:hypothetical protein
MGNRLMKSSVVRGVFCVVIASVVSGCFGGSLSANVGPMTVTPTVNTRRVKAEQPLRIVVDEKRVADAFVLEPAPGMKETFVGFRSSVSGALKKAFVDNFSAVSVVGAESRQGLELVVDRASFEKTHTIKFHVILLRDGVELVDVSGETKGRVVTGGRGDYEKIVRTLSEEAIVKMCEEVYDGTLRSEKLDASGLFGAPSPAPTSPVAVTP